MDIIATFMPDGDVDQAFVVGAMTQPQLATLGTQPIVGVRFLPGVGGTALGINATTLTDDLADATDIVQNASALRDTFRALHLNAANAHALHLFTQSIGLAERKVPPIVRHAAKELARASGPLRVEQVAKNLGISRQHLTRVFAAHSGLAPKLFAQICRVRALLSRAQSEIANDEHAGLQPASASPRLTARAKRDSWSTLALEFGYVDQSHLIAEVRTIIGQTPAAWQANARSNFPIVQVPVGPL